MRKRNGEGADQREGETSELGKLREEEEGIPKLTTPLLGLGEDKCDRPY